MISILMPNKKERDTIPARLTLPYHTPPRLTIPNQSTPNQSQPNPYHKQEDYNMKGTI